MNYDSHQRNSSAAAGAVFVITLVIGLLVGCLLLAGAVFVLFLGVRDEPMASMPPKLQPMPQVETRGDSDEPSADLPVETPPVEETHWRSLFDGQTLDGWELTNFGGEGEVHVEDGAIVLEMGSDLTGITFTDELPKNNYEFELEGMRREGIDFFCTTTFPVGDDFCTFVVGGWAGGVVGLSNVDEKDASDNVTTRRDVSLNNEQWYRVRIRVTDAKVECWIDDDQVVDLPREGHAFGIRPEVTLNTPLGIATWQTIGAVKNIRVRELPGT